VKYFQTKSKRIIWVLVILMLGGWIEAKEDISTPDAAILNVPCSATVMSIAVMTGKTSWNRLLSDIKTKRLPVISVGGYFLNQNQLESSRHDYET